jgi:hypothetical protein
MLELEQESKVRCVVARMLKLFHFVDRFAAACATASSGSGLCGRTHCAVGAATRRLSGIQFWLAGSRVWSSRANGGRRPHGERVHQRWSVERAVRLLPARGIAWAQTRVPLLEGRG